MVRKYFLPGLAFVGLLLAIYAVRAGSKPVPAAAPVAAPSKSPYEHAVAGAGIVEPATENIAAGVPTGQVVTDVFVKVGQQVKTTEPLMQLSDRTPRYELAVRKANLATAKAKLQEAEATYSDLENQLKLYESVADRRAVSEDELSRRRYAVLVSKAKKDTAEMEIEAAKAAIQQSEDDIDRLLIKCPKLPEGIERVQVLQVNIRAGEFAAATMLQTPHIVLGSTEILHVRVDVDENDAWRVTKGARATASLRGNADLKTELKFVRFEPFVIPKRSLTGESTERVDTRVLQVIYEFKRDNLPVFVGQQMDVYIEAPNNVAAERVTSGTAN